ncbi:MAG: response regulator [Geobacteraceae bacterium]|nr:response regulator [Geobacteraceae bacterium]
MGFNKILIADDETDIALILKIQLEDAGYKTIRVKDGVEALEALARESFELLLLDIKMPRIDGLQVLKKVRDTLPSMVVIMMTAHGSEEIAVNAMKDGALDYIAKPFSNDDMLKRVQRAISYNRTLQDNHRLQQELAAEQIKTEAILQGMAELLVAVDTEGRVISINRMAEYFLGRSRDMIIGKSLDELLYVDLPEDVELPLRKVLLTGVPVIDSSYSIAGPTGNIPVLSSAAPLYDNSGSLIGAVEIIRDISSLKALEREREDFVSMLSHDLKNPITSIVGSLDLVREGRLGPINKDQREFIEAAEESCSEMVEMINSLLDIHKFEAGRMIMAFKQENPRHLLEKLATQYSTAAEKAEIRLALVISSEMPQCLIDRTTFVRMIGNLLSNAIKFTPEKGEITVEADKLDDLSGLEKRVPKGLYPVSIFAATGSFLRVTVKDSGCGIPSEALGEIFDRFVQAKNRREGKSRGTGLGLAFCRKVMDAHKGFIWAESEEGKGSLFTCLFPVNDEV